MPAGNRHGVELTLCDIIVAIGDSVMSQIMELKVLALSPSTSSVR